MHVMCPHKGLQYKHDALEAAEECPHSVVIWQLMRTRTLPNHPSCPVKA